MSFFSKGSVYTADRDGREQKKLLPVVLALAWPMMLEELVFTLVQYVDYAMGGSLGVEATAAVGSTSTVNWMLGSSSAALGVGFVAYISQAFGARDEERARRASAQSILVTLAVGLFFTALTLGLSRMVPVWMQVDPAVRDLAAEYFFILYTPMLFRTATTILSRVLAGAGQTKLPMKIGIAQNLINVVLNFLMIYETRQISVFRLKFTMPGAGLGVRGAAIASAIAIACGGIMSITGLLRNKKISPIGYTMKPDPEILRPCLRVAVPNMLQRLITSFGYVIFASMINTIGTTATAAHTIANTVESAFYIPGYGMQVAAATLTGNAVGARDRRLQRNQAGVIITLEIGLMLVTGSLLFAFAPAMVGVFTSDPEVIELGSAVLRMVALSEPFYGVSIITEGMLQGAGCTKMPLLFNVAGMWGVRILGTFICTQVLGLGLISAWGCMIAHNMLLFVLFASYYVRGRWNPLRERVTA